MRKKCIAMIKSINSLAECTIISHVDNNNVIAEYEGIQCTAIFNPFTCLYYVDNVYGIIYPKEINKDV